ncbi:MAG: alpha/beta fold hydrolase [Rhizobiaceae bacterium]|nr:alpha/beta fold hydrolase [Rhizobiaceae bacterium]
MSFTSQFIDANDQRIHVMSGGPEDAPIMVMLHGFPEYWAAWATVAEAFTDRYRVILPDQRGFNLTSKPTKEAEYQTKHMVADLEALLVSIGATQPIILCGHDWGASIAYAFAMRHRRQVSQLIIANGVHPICFQKALLAAGAQTAASQYMNVLRNPGVEEKLAANRFQKLIGMLEKFSSAPWLDEAIRDAYRTSWDHKGALTGMLNWYRQSPMIVPDTEAPPQDLQITDQMIEKYHITMPHLLLWGMQDTALLPETRADLHLFCDDLTIRENADASHWILHEQPQWVADQINSFLR